MDPRLFVAVVCAGLAACAVGPDPTGGPPAAVAGFHCPPPGTSVTYDTGRRITWAGVDPTDPAVCLRTVETASGREEQPALFNYWFDTGANHRVLRAGMARLFPPAPDRASSFSRPGTAARGIPLDYQERWRVIGMETVRVGEVPRRAWRISRVTGFQSWQGGGFSGALTLWFDAETFVLLRVRVDDVQGSWRGVGPMTGVELRMPGA